MTELFARNRSLVVFRGVVAVVFGVLAIVWPQLTLFTLTILWGAYTLVDGIGAVAMGASGSSADRWLLLITGLAGIGAGIVAFVWPGITALFLLVLIAVWAVVTGIAQLTAAWRLRQSVGGAWLLGLTGAAGVALGVVLLARPADGALALVLTIGVFAIAWGVFSVLLGITLRADPAPGPGGPPPTRPA